MPIPIPIPIPITSSGTLRSATHPKATPMLATMPITFKQTAYPEHNHSAFKMPAPMQASKYYTCFKSPRTPCKYDNEIPKKEEKVLQKNRHMKGNEQNISSANQPV